MDKNYSYKNYDWLYEKYITKNMSIMEIAKICNVSYTIIQRNLKKNNIAKDCSKWDYRKLEFWQNEEWLRSEYEKNQKTVREISKITKCDPTTIHNWLKKFNIQRRANRARKGNIPWNKGLTKNDNISLARLSKIQRTRYTDLTQPYTKKDWLESQYIKLMKSQEQIAKECGCTGSTIRNWLIRFGIELRTKPDAIITKNMYYGKEPWKNKNLISRLYTDDNKTMKQIAKELKCDIGTIKYWIEKFGFPIRKPEDQKGKNNYNWRGGTTFLPYCEKFNDEFKESVRNKFNRKCFVCGIDEHNIIEKHGRLSVHHIDYFKNSICNGRSYGFIPLCGKHCHPKTNGKRWHWFCLFINYWAMNMDISFNMFPMRSIEYTENKYDYKNEIK